MQAINSNNNHIADLLDSLVRRFGRWLPDSAYLMLRYRFKMGKHLNLRTPESFQEKIQWLKIHDHNPQYTTMVDKVLVKDYVASIIGKEYVIPLLGIWDRPEDIEWERLPNRFVLKTNHGGGNTGVVICHDKATFDKNKAIKKLNASLRRDVYRSLREWPYRDIKKKVFAEEYIQAPHNAVYLPDYKWYCFNGEPMYCQVIQDRTTKETIDFFDKEWNHQEFVGLNPTAENAVSPPERPNNLDTHLQIARALSKGIPFSRIDMYEAGGNTYFGEITFYPASGLGSFRPSRYNEVLGSMITIPDK